MFKFTQIRPVNGINIWKIRKKHISLYDNITTNLLKSVQDVGLPRGNSFFQDHIELNTFKERLLIFENYSKNNNIKFSNLHLLILTLQKSYDFSKRFSSLNEKGNANLKYLLQQSRAIKNSFNFDIKTASEELLQLFKNKNDLIDDYYSLIMQSSFYPEYRRYIEIQYRLIYLINNYDLEDKGISDLLKTFFPEDTSLTSDQFEILKNFYSGKILLPQGIEIDKAPLPNFKTEKKANDFQSYELEAIKDLELKDQIVRGISSLKFFKEEKNLKFKKIEK